MTSKRAKSVDQTSCATTQTPSTLGSLAHDFRELPPSAIVYAVSEFIWGMPVTSDREAIWGIPA
jgi:hypothetical protein